MTTVDVIARPTGKAKKEIIPFKSMDIQHLGIRESTVMGDQYVNMLKNDPSTLECLENLTSFTGLWNGEPLCCGGLWHMWEGVAGAWAMFREYGGYSFDQIKWMSTACENQIRGCAERMGLWRVQATVARKYHAGFKFALSIGFKPETVMECYDESGRDHWLLSITWPKRRNH